jgi:glucosamine--fructose-6-phosphate aminotransferase (isomerizing)
MQTTLERERHAIAEAAAHAAALDIDRIFMIGCGDSLGAMLGVRSLFEHLLSVPCEPIQALDFAYRFSGLVNERTLVIALSSSGVTARVVEGVLLARAAGAHTLGLTNAMNSRLMHESDETIFIHATRKGWPTQSTTAAMGALCQFAFDLARRVRGQSGVADGLEQELYRIPDAMEQTIQQHDQKARAVAEVEVVKELCLFAGGGPAYACAVFGASKLKECSLKHGIAIPLEEYHHYVSQKDGDPLFLIAPRGGTLPRALDTARAGRAWGGTVYGVITRQEDHLKEHLDVAFELPPVSELLAPMVYSIPVQLFAYHIAMIQFAAPRT